MIQFRDKDHCYVNVETGEQLVSVSIENFSDTSNFMLLKRSQYFSVCGIYRIWCTVSNKSYIGKASNLYDRNRSHESAIRNFSHTNKRINNHINKYGNSQLRYEILEIILDKKDKDYVTEREIYWINYYNSYLMGFNQEIYSKYKDKLKKDRYLSPETRKKISNIRKDKPLTNIHKERISQANTGRIFNSEVRKNMSNAQKGRVAWNKDKKGFIQKEESKIKRSKALKEFYKNNTRINSNRTLNDLQILMVKCLIENKFKNTKIAKILQTKPHIIMDIKRNRCYKYGKNSI